MTVNRPLGIPSHPSTTASITGTRVSEVTRARGGHIGGSDNQPMFRTYIHPYYTHVDLSSKEGYVRMPTLWGPECVVVVDKTPAEPQPLWGILGILKRQESQRVSTRHEPEKHDAFGIIKRKPK